MDKRNNNSYKDQYHFTTFPNPPASELKSLDLDPPINSTIKENPYRSNVNVEGGEVVMNPDLSALFKAMGKKHSSGGMDVLLKPNSFIFSDDKTLAFTPSEKKLFEFKEGGKYSPSRNTPAEVLKKNVDVKHYNTLISNIQDVTKDNLARKSSAMMLEKYIETLGNIAYLQEAKKDFPDGTPSFSLGTAPIYNKDVKNEIMESKQYAKYGGKVNPYKAVGGYTDPECPCGRDKDGNCIPNCPEASYTKLLPGVRKVRPGQVPSDYNLLYQNPQASLYGKFDMSKVPSNGGPKMNNEDWINFLRNETPEHKARRLAKSKMLTNEDYLQVNPDSPLAGYNPPDLSDSGRPVPRSTPLDITPNSPAPNYTPQGSINADWEFTPWQKISQAYNWSQYAGAKRYMPTRSHYNAAYAEPSLLNPEQAVADVQSSGNQQLSALNSLNPILRNAQAQGIEGNIANTLPGIRSQYDNQNAGITNQFRLYNNQVKNDETLKNIGFDQNYYQQSVVGRQNFDNLRSYLANQAMNNTMRDVESNQSLAYNMLTLDNPAYGFNWKKGNFYRKPVDIRDVQRNPQADIVSGLLGDLIPKFDTLDYRVQAALLKTAALKGLPLPQTLGNTPPPFKKGGKTKRNPYKGY